MAGTQIKIKQSAVEGKIPVSGSLQQGELALNTFDQKLYSKDSAGHVFEIGGSSGAAMLTGATFTGPITAPDFVGPLNGAIQFTAKNTSGGTLTVGQVVYISGISGNTPTVGLADADDAAKMPAYGLVTNEAVDNDPVEITTFGPLTDVKTDYAGWQVGDTLYVSTTPGTLTNVPPTGEGTLIQNLGRIRRVQQSAGSITVGGAGRTNATPNLNDGNVFIGNASNQAAARALQIADTTGLQAALDGKVDDSQVLTNVPSGAVFTDTVYTHPTGAGNLHVPTGGTVGQVLTNTASGTGTWQDAAGGGGVNLTSATTAPASPSAGDQWFDTTNGILYAYMTDGTHSQWLDISSANGVAAASTGGGGAMELISTTVVSTLVTAVEFTGLDATYSRYVLKFGDVTLAGSLEAYYTVKDSTGTAINVNFVRRHFLNNGAISTNHYTSNYGITSYVTTLDAGSIISGELEIMSGRLQFKGHTLYTKSGASSVGLSRGVGKVVSTVPIASVSVVFTSTGVDNGTFSLYGIKD